MNFEDLSAFVAVAEGGSFSKAALRLRVSQSSLSKRVARLESHFGTTLLTRHVSGVQLTPHGQALLTRSNRLVGELRDIERDLGALVSEPAGEIRIALPPVTGSMLSPLIIEACERQFPRLRPRILEGTSANSHELLANGHVDLAITYNAEPGPDFLVVPLVAEPLVVIQKAPAHAGDVTPASYRLEDLARLPLLLPARPHSIRILVERLCAGRGIQLNVKYEVDGVNTLTALAERGLGVSIFGRIGFQPAIDQGRVVAVPIDTPLMNWKLCIAWPRKSERFIETLAIKDLIGRQMQALLAQGRWPGARWLQDEGTAASGSRA
jgi:LysR family nitrogen assimilation transcriptional regulator